MECSWVLSLLLNRGDEYASSVTSPSPRTVAAALAGREEPRKLRVRVEQAVDPGGRVVGQADASDELRSREHLRERAGERGRARRRDRGPIGRELRQEHVAVDEIPQDGCPEERTDCKSQEARA